MTGTFKALAQGDQVSMLKKPLYPLSPIEGIQGEQGDPGSTCAHVRTRLARLDHPAYSRLVAAQSATGRRNPDRLKAHKRPHGAFLLLHAQVLRWACRAGFGLAGLAPLVPGFRPLHVRHLSRVETNGGGSSTKGAPHG